jgi:hypothetical protein
MSRHLKITGFFMLLLMVLPTAVVLMLEIKKAVHKQEFKEKRKHDATIVISIPADSVIWIEDDEILIDGEMFDIKASELNNGIYVFKGYFDLAETDLVKMIRHASGESADAKDIWSSYFKWLPLISKEDDVEPTIQQFSDVSFIAIHSQFANFPLTVITPPPQC